jgi:hypothetical protein
MDQQEYASTSAAYLRFADEEARDRSALYGELARSAASDPLVIAFLLTLPKEKRQPNLLFAATRFLFGTPTGWCQFRRVVRENEDAIRAIMLKRSTQTNEPARCATLLPVLARLPQPLALIEVGASAGLCLIADRYGYDYGGHLVRPAVDQLEPPVFSCVVNVITPIPTALPRVIWRAGLDLDPVDLSDPDQTAWLEALVWPEQTDRLAKLRAAMRIAREDKPRVLKGDLRTDLARLTAEAPKDATLVVFHTAVLAYIRSQPEREEFARSVKSLCDFWISNESPRVLPKIAARVGKEGPKGCFLMSVNGVPVGWTDPHGASLDWISKLPERGAAARGLDESWLALCHSQHSPPPV